MGFFIHKKEKHIVELIKRHVDTVVDTVYTVNEALCLLLEGKKDESVEYTKKVHKKEHEADIIQREIDMEMFGGAFMPSIREDLFITVDTVDKVANRSEKLGDFLTLISPDVPEGVVKDVKKMGELTCKCAEKMRDAVYSLFDSMEAVHEDTIEIERYESKVDKIAWNILETIFKKLQIEKFSHRMMLREMIIHLSSISNKMEDASDRIDIIALRLKS
jgi:predicted phosphate transport protein (TIGR00153 family)